MSVLKLKHPLTVGDRQITELTFRDHAVANDLLAFDESGPNRQTIGLIANMSGMDEVLIGKLRLPDFRAADKIVSDLLKDKADEKNAPES